MAPEHEQALDEKRDALLAALSDLGSCAVAFSAGVDSTVVAQAAFLALGESAIAITAISPSLAEVEREQARQLADRIGIRHVELPTGEIGNDQYTQNAPDRCYHCKTELYTKIESLRDQFEFQWIVNGTNADDLGDYRPGLEAAREHRVVSPLADCHLTKDEIRQLAAAWELPVSDKPAAPCLSSRIAYGEEVTPDASENDRTGRAILT